MEHLQYLLDELDTNCVYHYINPATKRTLYVLGFEGGAFKYISYENSEPQKRVVTKANIQKIIGSIYEYVPFSIDAIVNASGNWRAGFESILAHTAEFFTCRVNNQKHLVWSPDKKHIVGKIGIWDDYDSLRNATVEEVLQQSSLILDTGETVSITADELSNILIDLYKHESRNTARILLGLKFSSLLSNQIINYVIQKTGAADREKFDEMKEDILIGKRLFQIASENKYGIVAKGSEVKIKSEDEDNTSKKTDVTKRRWPMRYELWNTVIQNYFFNDDFKSDIYISIDRDSFIDYISEKGILAEAIQKIQNYQRDNGRPVVTEEDYIWADFLRLFGPRDCHKSTFFRTMKEQVSLIDTTGLYMMFPYLALFTMPLANSPELHSRNYYTRLTNFLRDNQLIGSNETVNTSDMAAITSPSLQKLWESLADWAKKFGYNYQIKHVFKTDRNDYVAPILAECLFTAARKDKFKLIFYKAGLAPNGDLSDDQALAIMQHYHHDIDFDDTKWRDAKDKYQSLLTSTFIKEYNKWDGNAIVVKKEGKIRRQEYGGTRQSLLLRISIYRGAYEYGLLASLPDASNAEDFEYQSPIFGQYSFVINNKLANTIKWDDNISKAIKTSKPIVFQRVDQPKVELVYNTKECELMRADRSGYISTTELVAGAKYAVLILNNYVEKYKQWLEDNDAKIIKNHELIESHTLFEIPCVKVEYQNATVQKLSFVKTKSIKLVNTIRIPVSDGSTGLYQEFEAYFDIKGINVSTDCPQAVFNSETPIETVSLEYDSKSGLWFLPYISNKITRSKSFQIYCNNERLSSERFKLVDFEIIKEDCYAELIFNEYGECSESGQIKGLELEFSKSVNYQSLEQRMRAEGEKLPSNSGRYSNSDYLLYSLSTRPRVTKDFLEEVIGTLQFLGKFELNDNTKWFVREIINNYFRLGYINYAYFNSEHIIAINKPTLILLPPRCERIVDRITKFVQKDSYWTAILTGARTPEFMSKLFQRAENIKDLSYEIIQSYDGIMPETIFFHANDRDRILELANALGIKFNNDIYSNALLKKIASVESYEKYATQTVSKDYYDSITNFEVVDYNYMGETGRYRKLSNYDKNGAVVTYFPGSFRAQTVLWKSGLQYKVDKHWGHLLGMAMSSSKIVKHNTSLSVIQLPKAIQLPLLYARALTLITGKIPQLENQLRSYSMYDNPFTQFVNINVILNKLGQ